MMYQLAMRRTTSSHRSLRNIPGEDVGVQQACGCRWSRGHRDGAELLHVQWCRLIHAWCMHCDVRVRGVHACGRSIFCEVSCVYEVRDLNIHQRFTETQVFLETENRHFHRMGRAESSQGPQRFRVHLPSEHDPCRVCLLELAARMPKSFSYVDELWYM
jgi:hypothetical protein